MDFDLSGDGVSEQLSQSALSLDFMVGAAGNVSSLCTLCI